MAKSATQLAAVNTKSVVGNFTQSELDTIKNTITKGATNEEFSLFIQTCVNAGLNPFLNHIYFIKYGNTMNIQVSVEGVMALAREKEDYKGVDVQLVHENDEFNFNAKSKEIVHNVEFPRGKVIGGYAVAKREGFEDVVVLMEASEVQQHTNGNNKAMWTKYFNDMFKKHILKRAAKQQYGIEIGEDEHQSGVDSVSSYDPSQRRDITSEQRTIQTEENEAVSDEESIKKYWDQIHDKMNEHGMTKDELKTLIKEQFGKKPTELSLQEIVGLSRLVEMKQSEKKEPADDDFFGEFDQQELL